MAFTYRWCLAAAVLVGLPALTLCGRSASNGGSGSVGPEAPDSVGPGHDWTRFDWDAGRSGASTAPTGIAAGNVASMRRQQVELDGTVDASAIYLSDVQVNNTAHDVFFVTTTYGKTIAVNANTGAILWTYTPPDYALWVGSARITNATPVADPDRQFLYAVSPDGQVQKLAVADGHAVWSTAITLSPQSEKIASSLNYFAGRVVAVTGGYIGDAPPYQGHVAILDAGSGQLLHVWNTLCSDQLTLIPVSQCPESRSAIWGRAGAVIDSATGDIYVATGNGLWDGTTYWGDATLRLDSTATQLLGNYTPTNTQALAQADLDLGSTSPVLLGGGYVAQGGKDGKIRLLTAAAIAGAAPHMGGEAQVVSTPSGTGLFTAPAVLRTSTGTSLFAADAGGTAAWTVSGGQLSPAWHNGNAGTSPVIAGGLLYVYDPTGGALRVYQPATGTLVATLPCGSGHWNSPIIADGRIALPEGNANNHQTRGILDIWRATAP
jgi:outer membrane protein assembly factor BamB